MNSSQAATKQTRDDKKLANQSKDKRHSRIGERSISYEKHHFVHVRACARAFYF